MKDLQFKEKVLDGVNDIKTDSDKALAAFCEVYDGFLALPNKTTQEYNTGDYKFAKIFCEILSDYLYSVLYRATELETYLLNYYREGDETA